IDPTSEEALRNLATLLFETKEYAEAGKLFQALLVHRRDSMKSEEIVEVFFSLGAIKEELGEHAKALNMIEKALDVDPLNTRVLDRAIGIYEAKEDYEAVLRCKQNLVKAAGDDEARQLELHEEIGDLLVKKLKRSADAVKSYAKALEFQGDLRRVLYKAMEAHVALKQWDEALEMIRKMVESEEDPAHRYRLHHTAALILQEELKRPADAAEEFDLALQNDPTNMTAFEALKTLYTEQKKYRKLLRAYRLLLKRLPETTTKEKKVELWRDLADLAEEKLSDGREAIIALEMISKIDPKVEGHRERLAALYASAGPDAYEKAVKVNQNILDRRPLHKDAYKELYRLYAAMGQHDKAYCVSAALTLLKAATNEERRIYDANRPKDGDPVRRARAKLSDDSLWRDYVHHVQQVPVISEMLSIVTPVFVPMAIKGREELGLKVAEQLQLQEDQRLYAKVFSYASGVLEQAPTELYLRPNKEKLKLAMVREDVDGHDRSNVLFVDPGILNRSDRELHFIFARTLGLMRSEHQILYVSATPTVIRALALACIKLTNPEYTVKGDTAIIDRLADALYDQLPASHVDALAKRYDDLVVATKAGHAEQWMRAVELSIDHAGLLICDDLATAAGLASSMEPLAMEEGMTTKERVAQIFRYAVSEPYFAARAHLGLDLKI
ncbi:MAG: tetratricopeptide repeat protein, partial [Deltaproteobacteria bacterium]|nr:tetratricopeptide repeat protein [Deltaproteobacteria bacterium]